MERNSLKPVSFKPVPLDMRAIDEHNRRVLATRRKDRRATRLTALQLREVLGLLEPMLERLGGPKAKGNHVLAAAIEKLQDQFSRLGAKELAKLTNTNLFDERRR